jgi:hypothetical protein
MVTCAFCGKETKPRGLHNHHWKYGKEPYVVSNMCYSCHRVANAFRIIALLAKRDRKALRNIFYSMPPEMRHEIIHALGGV